MAKTKISEFSATPGNNTDIDGINIAEGCAPSGINDAIRELMSQLKDFQAGTAGDSFNGPVGTTTAAAGAFTTLSSTGNTTLGDASGDSVTINGNANFANVNPTLTAGTANGVAYLNGSKVLTTGSALTFDGSNLSTTGNMTVNGTNGYNVQLSGGNAYRMYATINDLVFRSVTAGSDVMTMTYGGNVGIGTSSPAVKLHVNAGAAGVQALFSYGNGTPTIAIGNSTTTYNTQIGYNVNSEYGYIQAVAAAGVYDDIAINPNGGNVGIGTSSPSTKLHLSDATNPTIRLQDTTYTGRYIDIAYNQNGVGEPDLVISRAVGGSPTTLATLDYSGNLGLGVTPSAWGSNFKATQIGNYGAFIAGQTGQSQVIVGANAYTDGTNWRYINASQATRYYQNAGAHVWDTAGSGTAGNAITFTQAMTLDASGNLLVGSTTKDFEGSIYLKRTSGVAAIDAYAASTSEAKLQLLNNSNSVAIGNGTGGEMVFYVNSRTTERARITSSGTFLVGKTASATANTGAELQNGTGGNAASVFTADGSAATIINRLTSDGTIVDIRRSGSTVGTISVTTTATAYNTSSDYRLKNINGPLTGSGEFIDALKPKVGTWKADGSKFVGFLAHEVQEISPSSVVGEKDAVDEDGKPIMQAMEYGSAEFIANIIAELQSLRKRVAALESK